MTNCVLVTVLGILQCLEPVVSSFLFAAPISFSSASTGIACYWLPKVSRVLNAFTVNARLAPLLILAFFLLKKGRRDGGKKRHAALILFLFSCSLAFRQSFSHCVAYGQITVLYKKTQQPLAKRIIDLWTFFAPLKPSNHFFGLVTLRLDVVSTNWLAFYQPWWLYKMTCTTSEWVPFVLIDFIQC